MNQDRLMKLVPAGVVLAVAVFLGLDPAKVSDFSKISTFIGFGAAIALMALAAYEYRIKRHLHGNR